MWLDCGAAVTLLCSGFLVNFGLILRLAELTQIWPGLAWESLKIAHKELENIIEPAATVTSP